MPTSKRELRPPPGEDRSARVLGRRYHVGWMGALYVLTTLFLAMGAFRGQNNLLFLFFGFAVAGIFVSGVLSGWMLMNVSLSAHPAPPVHAGGEALLEYTVGNRGRFLPVYALRVEPIIEPNAGVLEARGAFTAQLDARSTQRVVVRARALRRGVAVLPAVMVSSSFPFGLIRKSVVFAQGHEVVVYPALEPASALPAAGGRGGVPEQSHARAAGRSGEEFYALRPYAAGDSPRLIAWRASARRGELRVRQMSSAAGRDVRVWVSLRGAAGDQERERAIAAAAWILWRKQRDGLAVGLAAPGMARATRTWAAPEHLHGLWEILARLDAASPAPLPSAPHGTADELVVHAGSVDASVGPPGAVHVSVRGGTA